MFSRLLYVLVSTLLSIPIVVGMVGCNINAGYFNTNPLIPASIVLYNHGTPKTYETGRVELLTKDTKLRLEGITKPSVKLKIYTSASDPNCEKPPRDEDILGTDETLHIDFGVDLSVLPEGTHTLCIYAESPTEAPLWKKLGDITIKRTVQAFSGTSVLPAARGNDRLPQFIGKSEANARLELYSGSNCSGPPLEFSQAAPDGSFSINLSAINPILIDGPTVYSVLATDVLGNTLCSPGMAYTLDTIINPTSITALTPASPSNVSTPALSGVTEINSQISLYDSTTCAGPLLGSTTPDPAGVFTINLDTPLVTETTYNFTLRVTDDLGNTECFTGLNQPYTFDVTPPPLNILSPAAGTPYQNVFALSLSCEADAAIEVSGDIVTILNQTCTAGSVTLHPSLSGVDGTKNITVKASDAAGNITTATLSLIKDTVAPTLPAVTRTSASPTSSAVATMTVSSCSDITEVLVKESSSLPTGAEPEWTSCSTVASALLYDLSLSNAQGTRNLRVFVRDGAGNIQPAFATVLVDYDTLPPEIHINPIPAFLGTKSYYEFQWSLTEGNVPAGANFVIQYSQNAGSSWTTLTNTPVGRIGAVNGKIYKYNQLLPETAGPTLFKISLTDATGQTGSDSKSTLLLFDITPPVITANTFKIIGSEGPITTYNPFVKVEFEATDNQTPITQFCLKNSSNIPLLTDPCWVALDAPGIDVPIDLAVALSGYDHLVDWIQGTYTVYLWVRDQAGNVSSNTGPVNNGTDRISVTYAPVPQPVLTNLLVAKVPDPVTQPSPWELVTTPGTLLYLKWKQRVFMGTAKVSLWYTVDGVDYTMIVEDLSPGAGLSCVASGSDDICTYSWNSTIPVNTSYKIQVRLSDGIGQTMIKNTVYISNPNFRPIAGNTDPGTNGSAKSAAFRGAFPDNGSFVVSRNGILFYRDIARGLLMVDPANGVQKLILKDTGATTGDGGPLSNATTQGILKIAIDFQDRVLLFEPDRIRRIDTRATPMTIESIIGAFDDGRIGTNTADYIADPHDIKIQLNATYRMAGQGSPYLTFLVLPSGDIYFQSDNLLVPRAAGARIRIYRGSAIEPYIDTLRVGGAGDAADGATDIGAWDFGNLNFVFDPFSNVVSKALVILNHPNPGCSNFNYANVSPTTLQSLGGGHPSTPFSTCAAPYRVQGMNGQIYGLNRNNPWSFQIAKFDGGAGWNAIIGTGNRSSCVDGTAALSCSIIPNDLFVSQTGQIYFMDDGLIRIVGSDGKIYTLYGYNLSAGDGGEGMEARLNNIVSLDHGTGDKVIVLDNQGGRFREIDPKGTPGIKTIAGNGADAPSSQTPLGVAANVNPIGMGWQAPGRFTSDPSTGDVYWNCGYQSICKLNRAANIWQSLFALGGGVAWESTSPVYYSSLEIPPYLIAPSAFANNALAVGFISWNGTDSYRSVLRDFSLADGLTKHIAGNSSTLSTASCSTGTASGCSLDTAYYGFSEGGPSPVFHSNSFGTNYWLVATNQSKRIVKVGGGTAAKLFELNEKALSILVQGSYFYYCSSVPNTPSKLYRKMTTSPYTEVELPLPHGSTCFGNKIIFKTGTGGEPDRIVFPIKQNGISGVAEFLDPENFVP